MKLRYLAAGVAIAVGACSSSGGGSDPYERFLKLAPKDAPHLSRDDALARAALGCSTNWPKGTTDWALHEAYGSTVCK